MAPSQRYRGFISDRDKWPSVGLIQGDKSNDCLWFAVGGQKLCGFDDKNFTVRSMVSSPIFGGMKPPLNSFWQVEYKCDLIFSKGKWNRRRSSCKISLLIEILSSDLQRFKPPLEERRVSLYSSRHIEYEDCLTSSKDNQVAIDLMTKFPLWKFCHHIYSVFNPNSKSETTVGLYLRGKTTVMV